MVPRATTEVAVQLLLERRWLSAGGRRANPVSVRSTRIAACCRPTWSGELELDLAGTSAHRAHDDLDVVAELGHQFQQLGFADAAELAAGDA